MAVVIELDIPTQTRVIMSLLLTMITPVRVETYNSMTTVMCSTNC